MSKKKKNKVKKFAGLVKQMLKIRGMTITEFARKLGVSRETIYLWLRSQSDMGLGKYYACLEVLGLQEELKDYTSGKTLLVNKPTAFKEKNHGA